MSEPESGVGETLRAAREARGLSIQDAAHQLRLMNRQVAAMEAEDFASLGQPVFARGFVRNYARMLGLDDAAILRAMGGALAEPVEVSAAPPLILPGKWFTSGWLIAGMILLLLFTVVPIGLYAWLSSDAEEVTRPVTREIPPPAVSPSAIAPGDVSNRPVTANPGTETVASTLPDGTTANPGVSTTEPAAVPPSQREMRFEFDEDAWLEVKEGTGQILYRKMNQQGSTLVLTGQLPLDLVIGNAMHVRMTYQGRPLDLTPYINANVARFSLEE